MRAGPRSRIAAILFSTAVVGGSMLAPLAMAAKPTIRLRVCGVSILGIGSDEQVPEALSSAPEPTILSRFAILRRAAGPTDELPPINLLGLQLGSELAGYYPAYIRQLAALPGRRRVFLVPGLRRAIPVPPGRCLPKALRSKRNALVRRSRELAREVALCTGVVDPHAASSERPSCQTLADVEAGTDLVFPDLSVEPSVHIVPDAVAMVRLSYRTGATIMASVSENTFVLTPSRVAVERLRSAIRRLLSLPTPKHLTNRGRQRRIDALSKLLKHAIRQFASSRVEWLDSTGHVLRVFTPHLVNEEGSMFGRSVSLSTG